MKKNLQRISTVGMAREEWQKYQLKTIGGSSSSAILGVNPFMSALELFYFYLGNIPQKSEENQPMFWGTEMEEQVAQKWRYWENDADTMMKNFRTGHKTQDCRKVNAILYNPAFPHLHANIDRQIVRNIAGRRGILEIKNISSYAADRYEGGIPIGHIIQIQHYLVVTEEDYAELAMLKDGRVMEVFSFERNDNICATIIQKTTEFWDKVTLARIIMDNEEISLEDRQAAIVEFEPEPDDTKACEEFLKKRYRTPDADAAPIEADTRHYEWVKAYKTCGAHISKWEKIQQGFKNRLIHDMADREVIDFGSAGKVTYRANEKGSRTLRVGVKLLEDIEV